MADKKSSGVTVVDELAKAFGGHPSIIAFASLCKPKEAIRPRHQGERALCHRSAEGGFVFDRPKCLETSACQVPISEDGYEAGFPKDSFCLLLC